MISKPRGQFLAKKWFTFPICHLSNRFYEICLHCLLLNLGKVEKIYKGSLDSIPSPLPSVKIQIMGEKVCLRCKSKKWLGVVNKLVKINPLQCFVLLPQVNFPADNLNFH